MRQDLIKYLRYVRQRDAGAIIPSLMMMLCALGFLGLLHCLNTCHLLWVNNHFAY